MTDLKFWLSPDVSVFIGLLPFNYKVGQIFSVNRFPINFFFLVKIKMFIPLPDFNSVDDSTRVFI